MANISPRGFSAVNSVYIYIYLFVRVCAFCEIWA